MTTPHHPSIPLSPRQVAAIETPADQPSLILAGAGTGKTTVLTHRVAHLIQSGLPPESVYLLTFTNKAKGLEYPVVFLPGLQQDGFPHPKATTETQLEEEHRLFYVALTRAKERLYLSACQKGRPSPGGYFDQLPHDLIDTPTI